MNWQFVGMLAHIVYNENTTINDPDSIAEYCGIKHYNHHIVLLIHFH